MFEKVAYYCPRCGYEIHEKLEDGMVFVCAVCAERFRYGSSN